MKLVVEVCEGSKFSKNCKSMDVAQVDPKKFYCVRIQDYGEGMDKDILNRMFDPFFTTKDLGEGTGMGLSMVYGTISNHNGVINVDSDIGAGTTFYIYLKKEKNYQSIS